MVTRANPTTTKTAKTTRKTVNRGAISSPEQSRAGQLVVDRAVDDGELVPFRLTFSSETAQVPREFIVDGEVVRGLEVLDHGADAVDLSFLASGRAPLLVDHDLTQHVGVIDSAEVRGRTGHATGRFSRRASAREVARDVTDGIRQSVSVGYTIERLRIEDQRTGPPILRVLKWKPHEISVLSVPADAGVGFQGAGRGEFSTTPTVERRPIAPGESEDMNRSNPGASSSTPTTTTQHHNPPPQRITSAGAPDGSTSERAGGVEPIDRDSLIREERSRQNAIMELATRHQRRDLADAAIQRGTSLELFKGILLDAIGLATPLETPISAIGISQNETRQYSFVRLLEYLSQRDKTKQSYERAAFELECSETIGARLGRSAKGIYVPQEAIEASFTAEQLRALAKRNPGGGFVSRTMDVATSAAAGDLVGTQHQGQSFIEVLYNSMQVRQLGATVLSGLVGNIQIPRRTAGGAVRWTAEQAAAVTGGNLNLGDSNFDQVPLTPREVTTTTMMTRRLLQQSDPSIEALVRSDLATAIALGIDSAAISGDTGVDPNMPTGILNQAGVNTVAMGTNGAAITYQKAINFIAQVMRSNAIGLGGLGWLINANVWEAGMTTTRDAGSGRFLIEGESFVGRPYAHSEQVPSNLTKGTGTNLNAAIFGAWSQLMIGEWGVLDLQVDPYTAVASGAVRVNAFMTVDLALRHASAFSISGDIL